MGHALPFQSSAGNGEEQRKDEKEVANVVRGEREACGDVGWKYMSRHVYDRADWCAADAALLTAEAKAARLHSRLGAEVEELAHAAEFFVAVVD